MLKEWAKVYRSTKTRIHDRLQETQFCLEASFRLYLTYRVEKGFISKDEAREHYNRFYGQLRSIVREQNARVNQSKYNEPKQVNYLMIIRSLYKDKSFRLVRSIKDFEEKEHDGIVHRDHIFFRRDKLIKRIRTYEPSAEFEDAVEYLIKHQALKPGNGSNSRKLGGSRLRFYAIKLAKLQ